MVVKFLGRVGMDIAIPTTKKQIIEDLADYP